MIGKVTWFGHVTCANCPRQVADIEWGDARRLLRSLGWKRVWRKNNYVYVCAACAPQALLDKQN